MLKRLRKKLTERNREHARRLAAALCGLAVLAVMTAPAWADTGAQSFNDGQDHPVNDNIVANNITGLDVSGAGTQATMNGWAITVSGSGYGAHAASGGAISMTNTTVTTSGGTSYGLFAEDAGSTVTTTGGSVTTNGNFSYGLVSFRNGSTINLTNTSVTTSGILSIGVYAVNHGAVSLTNGSITTTGLGSHGAYAFLGSITLTNTAVNASGYGLFASAGTINAAVNGQDISGAGGLLAVDNGGAVNLTATGGSRLYGAAYLNGGTVNLTLGNSAWTMPGDSRLTTLTLNNGSVAFLPPSAGAYKTLTLGTIAGSGGSFYLNANVAADKGDSITVTASAGGSNNLYVRDWGGTPGDLHKTVKLTTITGASNATFGGGGDVGAWRYGVAQGSALSSAYTYGGSAAGGSDYYLYNTFSPSTPVRTAMGDSAAGKVMWYGEMNEIKKRLGELRLGTQTSDDFWVRTYADKFNVRPDGGDSFDQTVRGIELGRDNQQTFADGKKHTGFLVGAGKADNTFAGGGSGDIDSVYAGAYGSWLRDDGSYFDLIGKYNRFSHSFNSPVFGGGSDSGSYKNNGFGLSTEIGRRFERGNGIYVQPEAELSALWSGNASYISANGLAIQVPSDNSLQLRLGCTIGRKWQKSDGGSRQLYGKVSWINEFRGNSRTVVDQAAFDSSLKGNQWVTGLGFVEDAGNCQLYMDVEKSWGNAVSKTWGANLGCRWKF